MNQLKLSLILLITATCLAAPTKKDIIKSYFKQGKECASLIIKTIENNDQDAYKKAAQKQHNRLKPLLDIFEGRKGNPLEIEKAWAKFQAFNRGFKEVFDINTPQAPDDYSIQDKKLFALTMEEKKIIYDTVLASTDYASYYKMLPEKTQNLKALLLTLQKAPPLYPGNAMDTINKTALTAALSVSNHTCTTNYKNMFYTYGQKRGAYLKKLLERSTPFNIKDFTSVQTLRKDLAAFHFLTSSQTLEKKYYPLLQSYLKGLNKSVRTINTKNCSKIRVLMKNLLRGYTSYAKRANSMRSLFTRTLPFVGYAIVRIDKIIPDIDWEEHIKALIENRTSSLDLSTLQEAPSFKKGLSTGLKLAALTQKELDGTTVSSAEKEALHEEIFIFLLENSFNASRQINDPEALPIVQYCAGIVVSRDHIRLEYDNNCQFDYRCEYQSDEEGDSLSEEKEYDDACCNHNAATDEEGHYLSDEEEGDSSYKRYEEDNCLSDEEEDDDREAVIDEYYSLLSTIGGTLAFLVGSYHYDGETYSTYHQTA